MLNSHKIIFLFLLGIGVTFADVNDLYVEKRHGQTKVYGINFRQGILVEAKDLKPKTPLGSLWKLFIYAYNKENNYFHSPYICEGNHQEEIFCCKKGMSINEDEALAKSCGLYFSPKRLQISKRKWQEFWLKNKVQATWLLNLDQLKPEVVVEVGELFNALETVRNLPRAKQHLDKSLMQVVLRGTAKKSLSQFGSLARIKTFTWDHPKDVEKYMGGFAGWLVDGTPVWGGGSGRSSDYLERVSPLLYRHWRNTIRKQSNQCVTVRYFHDYQIDSVTELSSLKKINQGSLVGKYRIDFKSGSSLTINSNQDLSLKRVKGHYYIDGRMALTSYLARVLDREVNPHFSHAAEAFSIIMRSYLFERAKKLSDCYHVIDSSKFQRVSASLPSPLSMSIATKTSDLILNNVSQIRYHLSKDEKGMASWKKAKSLDQKGGNFIQILRSFYPNSQIIYGADHYSKQCGLIEKADQWLKHKSPLWHRLLIRHPGYEKPQKFKVCQLSSGAPFANKNTNEIYVRGFEGFENQFSIAHEYLHLAFKHHPIGNSEKEIDNIAKKLVRMF